MRRTEPLKNSSSRTAGPFELMAHQAIGMEPRVGAMLPCNVILREVLGGIDVSAIDPVACMQAIDNAELAAVAGQVCEMLAEAVAAI